MVVVILPVKERFEFPEDVFKTFDGEVLRLQLPDGLSTKEALAKLAEIVGAPTPQRVVVAYAAGIVPACFKLYPLESRGCNTGRMRVERPPRTRPR